jgi:hypothetical protein
METKLTFNLLPVLAVIISVLAWYIPGFNTWYEKLTSSTKQLFMLGVLAVVTLGTALLSGFGFLTVYHGATWQQWIWYPLVDFVIAAIANAGTYKATNKLLGKE